MSLPVPSTFQVIIPSHELQPAAGLGALCTPLQNAYGAWQTVIAGASVTDDVWELLIRFNDADSIGVAMNMLAQIGLDPAGGVAFGAFIDHLQCSYAGPYLTSGALGVEYKFRVHIAAGTSIGCRTSVNSATLKTVNCSVVLSCSPTKPATLWKGTFVRTYGAVPASSQGTSLTPGQISESAWVDLGTLVDDIYEWQLGFGADDSTIGSTTYHLDLGVATGAGAKRVVILNQKNSGTTAEIWNRGLGYPGSGLGAIGDHVFGRVQGSAAPDGPASMIGYGIGGAYVQPGLFTVAGVVQVGGVPVANGKTVEIFAKDSDNIVSRIGAPTTSGGTGAFTLQVPDNTRTYWASYADGTDLGRSANGTAGVSTFNITIGGAAAAVVITNNTTTAELIRDKIIALIKAAVSTICAGDRFRAYRNEDGADFIADMENDPQGAFRRYQVRDVGTDRPPDVSNTDVEGRFVKFHILVAYPQTGRTGSGQSLDRDDAMSADQHLIEQAIGLNGYANFTGASNPNAAWFEGSTERIVGNGVDFLLIEQSMHFYRRMVP